MTSPATASPTLLSAIPARPAPRTITILLGNGDGTFRTGQTIPVGTSPFAIALADLDGDGKLDIVATSLQDNSVTLLLGNGDGTFLPAIEVPAGLGALRAGRRRL